MTLDTRPPSGPQPFDPWPQPATTQAPPAFQQPTAWGAEPNRVAPQERSGRRRVAELSLVALLSAGLATGGTYAVARTTGPAAAPATASQSAALPQVNAPVVQANGSTPDWTATAKAVSPSVVAIAVSGPQGEGEGSGVVIDTAGHVLTNNHVATGGGSGATLRVTLDDGRTYAATIVGTDPSTDLAVLQLTNPPSDLRPISFGDSKALAVGDPVMAVGNPLGLAGTVTTGIVSALDRPVSTGSSQQQPPRGGASSADTVVTNAIQTSAAINPGNSGGALVDASGRLVGINSAIASLGGSTGSGQGGNIGIGFAIPSNTAKLITEQLIATGTAQHAYLGVSSADGTATTGTATREAAVVRTVAAGSPAAQAGLQAGDAVVALDGRRVDSSLGLVAAIREQRVGATVTLTVVRGGQTLDVKVALAARPQA
ncbi:MAG TPA: trypsin-like peptidase domain-containing protein [Dermatophilaceae bacterium]|nr:trypsin-like peptidase domain-containing protein [Dermatophilaceae bacterium]